MPISVEISKGMEEMLGEELKNPETQLLLRRGVEEELKTLLLFKAVDNILKKSKLSDKGCELPLPNTSCLGRRFYTHPGF